MPILLACRDSDSPYHPDLLPDSALLPASAAGLFHRVSEISSSFDLPPTAMTLLRSGSAASETRQQPE